LRIACSAKGECVEMDKGLPRSGDTAPGNTNLLELLLDDNFVPRNDGNDFVGNSVFEGAKRRCSKANSRNSRLNGQRRVDVANNVEGTTMPHCAPSQTARLSPGQQCRAQITQSLPSAGQLASLRDGADVKDSKLRRDRQ